MRVLFVHQNFPGQYKHLAPALARDPGNEVISIGERREDPMASSRRNVKGLRHISYDAPSGASKTTHPYLQGLEAHVRRGQAVTRIAVALRKEGFVPDIICAHPGWGESLYLKGVFPESQLLNYYEFYYRIEGADMGFDPEFPTRFDDTFSVPMRNATQLLSLAASDWGVCPTEWQRMQFPSVWRTMMSVIHEGIDTHLVRPDGDAIFRDESKKLEFTRHDEVVTYVARNLEPYRGFHVFMRALPALLERRRNAHVLIVGGDESSYGRAPIGASTWREQLMKEIGADLDMTRIHFLGKVSYRAFLNLVQVSSVHVYLTVPFILSWSLLEAMSAGCLIVASRTAPVQEVLQDEVNGLLVDFLSPTAITDRIVEALEHQEEFRGLRERARQTAIERFDLTTVCLPQHLALINRLVSR